MTLAQYLVLAAAAPAVGSACADPPPDKAAAFKSLDIDGDGLVSKAEAAGHEGVTLAFDRADRDRDGKLSVAEYERYAKAKDKAKTRQAAARKGGSASAGGTSPKKAQK